MGHKSSLLSNLSVAARGFIHEIREVRGSSCEVGGLAGLWGFTNSTPFSLGSFFFASFLLVPSHAGPRSRVGGGAAGFAGLTGGWGELSYDWLLADGGPCALGDWDMSLPMISFTGKRGTNRKSPIMTHSLHDLTVMSDKAPPLLQWHITNLKMASTKKKKKKGFVI